MKKATKPIRVILADDHELFRDGFSVMIKKQPDVEIIAEAGNGEDLLHEVRTHLPDVVITDIKMPKLDGVGVVRALRKELPGTGVIALTNYDEESLIVEMLEAGAMGYLLKSAGKLEILEAIKTVYEGKTYYCNHTNEKLAGLIAKSSFQPFRKEKEVVFNNRERGIIVLICQGLTNKEIAEKLFLSRRTIETHREHILEKMEVKNTAGVVVYAIRHGLYQL